MVEIYTALKRTHTKSNIKERKGMAPGYFSYIICMYVFFLYHSHFLRDSFQRPYRHQWSFPLLLRFQPHQLLHQFLFATLVALH